MPIREQASLETIGSAMVKVVPEGRAKAVLSVSAVAATMETQLAIEMLDGPRDAVPAGLASIPRWALG